MPAIQNRPPQRTLQRRVIFNPANRFDFDASKKPDHVEYQWARVTLAGQEDKEHQIITEMNGWTPVPAERHPELSGRSAKPGEAIVRGGLMLVELPKEYAEESQELEKFQAADVLHTQIQRLGAQARKNGARGITRSRDVIQEVVE